MQLSIIIPTYHSKELITICIKSFEKFKPSNLSTKYIVVENSSDTSYKKLVQSLANNVLWINNETKARGSKANAEGLEIGLKYVNEELVFLAHCDICLTSHLFLEIMFQRIQDGDQAVAFLCDRARIQAMHILALLAKTEIVKKSDLQPKYHNGKQILDVGDGITQYCRENDIKYSSLDNTYNNPELERTLSEKFKKLSGMPRCVYNNEVLCMHLGRGILKTEGKYNKPNRVLFHEWVQLCEEIINEAGDQ